MLLHVGYKKEPSYFVRNQQIVIQLSLLHLKMNGTYGKLYPKHYLISVTTLPCESQNTENVTLQLDITKENCIRCIIALSKLTRVMSSCALHSLI